MQCLNKYCKAKPTNHVHLVWELDYEDAGSYTERVGMVCDEHVAWIKLVYKNLAGFFRVEDATVVVTPIEHARKFNIA